MSFVPPLRSAVRRAAGVERSPLCRPADRLRAALLLSLVPLLVAAAAGGWLIGLLALHSGLAADARDRPHRHRVAAVTLAEPTVSAFAAPDVDGASGSAPAPAVWHYPGTVRHTATVPVPASAKAGTRAPIWVDDRGRIAEPPRTPGEITGTAALAGAGTLLGEGAVLALLGGMTVRLLDRWALGAWSREWAGVEPVWSGRRRYGTAPDGS
jgi:hypothetical protein